MAVYVTRPPELLVGEGVMLGGQVMVGGVVSVTLTEKAQVATLPARSDTLQLPTVSPRLNLLPVCGVQASDDEAIPTLSVAVGLKLTVTKEAPVGV